ncbi:MAG: hypothetical protein KIH09_17335 [Candidatus Freyarchaeota archaeon]|nr:hypothetical protein [Candidatus Jordarchaeia archaeon]
MMFLGFLSGDIAIAAMGLTSAFVSTSFFFTFYIKRELGAKKFLAVIFGAASLGIIIYRHIITGSLILEIATLFLVAMILMPFLLSYFLPRIHAKLKTSKERVENEICMLSLWSKFSCFSAKTSLQDISVAIPLSPQHAFSTSRSNSGA